MRAGNAPTRDSRGAGNGFRKGLSCDTWSGGSISPANVAFTAASIACMIVRSVTNGANGNLVPEVCILPIMARPASAGVPRSAGRRRHRNHAPVSMLPAQLEGTVIICLGAAHRRNAPLKRYTYRLAIFHSRELLPEVPR
jgi:hypothetical protein